MKTVLRLIALLLCFTLLTGIVGCGQTPAPTEPTVFETQPPTQAPTEPPADLTYQEAADKLAGLSDVMLESLLTFTTTVADQTFTEQRQQTLTYAGIGSDAAQISLVEKLRFNIDDPQKSAEEKKDIVYSEVFADGTVYTSMELEAGDTYLFASPLTQEESGQRYLPPVILDAAIYGNLTSEATGSDITIHFSEPTAPESWAIPADAEMTDAFGSAVIDSNGNIRQMNYTVTYHYGSAEVKLEVESKPQTAPGTVTAPDDADAYINIQYADALRAYLTACGMLTQAESVTASHLESIMCQAAGVMRNQSTTMDLCTADDLMTKVETNLYLMDYTTNQSQELKQEELYLDDKYTVTIDDGVPTSQSGVDAEVIDEYCSSILVSHLCDPDYWKDAAVTDLGSTYLVEYTYTTNFGDTIQNSICSMFWNDPAFLNKLASDYATNETSGYIALDKYTGLPTAAGYFYKGTHTIEGADYELTFQTDQSLVAPSFGAYHEITDEMPTEAEPESKAAPLFYHVTGDKGQEMWLFGTIHVGDARTAYLPQEIYDALNASDALALEYYSNGFDEKLEEDDALQEQISSLYYYSDGSTTSDHLGEEIYEKAVKVMKASGNYNMNAPYMKPSVWSQSIENFYLRQGYQLTNDQGCESRLEKLAEDAQKEIRDVESALFQIRMTTGWSEDLQKVLLEEALEYSASEYWEETYDLYEKWCAGDEAVLREALSDEVDLSELTEEELAEYEAEKHLLEEYNKAMSYDRNDGMLGVAIDYLESGDTVFFAVGLAHLLNNVNGLVDTLRDAGYTVEQVQYAN